MSVEEAARRAIELRDFSELRGLSSAVAVIEETRARSIGELVAAAGRCGDPGERARIEEAAKLVGRYGMLPERREAARRTGHAQRKGARSGVRQSTRNDEGRTGRQQPELGQDRRMDGRPR